MTTMIGSRPRPMTASGSPLPEPTPLTDDMIRQVLGDRLLPQRIPSLKKYASCHGPECEAQKQAKEAAEKKKCKCSNRNATNTSDLQHARIILAHIGPQQQKLVKAFLGVPRLVIEYKQGSRTTRTRVVY